MCQNVKSTFNSALFTERLHVGILAGSVTHGVLRPVRHQTFAMGVSSWQAQNWCLSISANSRGHHQYCHAPSFLFLFQCPQLFESHEGMAPTCGFSCVRAGGKQKPKEFMLSDGEMMSNPPSLLVNPSILLGLTSQLWISIHQP